MSIKFPDFQVLVARADQAPRLNRDSDQLGAAGKVTPGVAQDFSIRERRVDHTRAKDQVRQRDKRQGRRGQSEEEAGPGQRRPKKKSKRQSRGGSHIDLRA